MVNILKQIEQVGSTLSKVEIVKNLSVPQQDLLKEIYEDCYGPQMYYIKKQPVTSFDGLETIENDYVTFHRALKDLAERKINGNNALNYITNIISLYRKEDQEWLIRILMKDLKIGYSKTSWEKIFGKGNKRCL